MQWTAGPQAGFSSAEPWIGVNPNHTWLNAEAQRDDPASVLAFYRSLVALRHDDPVVVHGDFTLLQPDHPRLWAFARTAGEQRLAVYANCSGEPLDLELDPADRDAHVVLANLTGADRDPGVLRPWEVRVVRSGPPAG